MDAEVMFDYEKSEADELNLRVGDIIHNVKTMDEGWCEGELNGVRGMFPDNFVKLKPASSQPPVSLRNGEAERKQRRAKVIYSYVAQCEDELTLELGKTVDIIAVEEEGWFKGRVDNRVGVFPSNFVEETAEGAPPHRAPSPDPAPPEPAVDSQTGERQPPSMDSKPGGVRGPMLMPAFDPNKARAQLKQTSKTNVAAPPPETKKPPPSSSTTSKLQRARVTYDYEAENSDELTVKVGDILEILEKEPEGQEGWVMARLKDKKGLIADVFYEVIEDLTPSSQQSPPHPKQPEKPPPPGVKEPSSKQMVPPPAQKKPETKKPLPPVIPAKTESPEMDQTDFPVPKTTPLDSSAVRDRPKTKNRPPTSRSNLHATAEEEAPAAVDDSAADESTKNLPPWKRELMNKKKQPKLAPKPAGKPAKPPATGSRDPVPTPIAPKRAATMDKVTKPDPPPMARSRLNTGGSKPEPHPTPATSTPAKPAAPKPTPVTKTKPPETKSSPVPQESPTSSTPASSSSSSSNTTTAAPPPLTSAAAASPSVVVDNSWKEAYEKLQSEFASFKSVVMDMVNTLTDDLDKERKLCAALEVDIDRLKKTQRSLVN